MRLVVSGHLQRTGGTVAVFNGVDGEWSATVAALDKKRCELQVLEQIRTQPAASLAPELLFGVLKGQRLSTLVEKATELGVGAPRRPLATGGWRTHLGDK